MTEITPSLPAGTSCWLLTNGMAGYDVQTQGLAEALGLSPEIKRINPTGPWSWLAPHGPAQPNADICPPWPDLLIAAGRQAIPYARAIKKASKGRTFVAILQNPGLNPRRFDFVWAPAHDRLSGPNTFSTLTSPSRITPARLASEAEKVAPSVAHLPSPRATVLIGGTNKVYRLDEPAMEALAASLKTLAQSQNISLLVTPSRRTGAAQTAILRATLKDTSALVWDGTGDNPYFGYLGLADIVLVTCDSVNMVGEAASTGKPTYVLELEGGSPKFRRFLDGMYDANRARPFAGSLASWDCPSLNETQKIADTLAAAMIARDRQPAQAGKPGRR